MFREHCFAVTWRAREERTAGIDCCPMELMTLSSSTRSTSPRELQPAPLNVRDRPAPSSAWH